VRAALPWLCLLIAELSLALALQLAVAVLPLNTASPPLANAAGSQAPIVPMRSRPVMSPVAADDKRSAISVQGQCDAMSEQFTADLLVAMTKDELDYLTSTLCPISS
jgi:hypothetical protein